MTNSSFNEETTFLTFPCDFSIKVVGEDTPEFEQAVLSIIHKHAPDLSEGSLRTRQSKKGKYLSFTVTIQAHSKAQIDAIYLDLTACKLVLMAL